MINADSDSSGDGTLNLMGGKTVDTVDASLTLTASDLVLGENMTNSIAIPTQTQTVTVTLIESLIQILTLIVILIVILTQDGYMKSGSGTLNIYPSRYQQSVGIGSTVKDTNAKPDS